MQKDLFERDHRALGIMLVILAPVNAWMAYTLYPQHPLMASASAGMAVVIVAGVVLFWRAGKRR